MTQSEIITALSQLGNIMQQVATKQPFSESWGIREEDYDKLVQTIQRQQNLNGWFTEDMVNYSLLSHGKMLDKSTLENFVRNYTFSSQPKRLLVIMAGNIPIVGFHDFICVLLSGNYPVAKLSSDDQTLLPVLGEILTQIVWKCR